MQKFLYLVLACLLLSALSAPAQNKCVAIRGIAQESLLDIGNPEWKGGDQGPPWQGPVQLALGQDEVLIGWVTGPGHWLFQFRFRRCWYLHSSIYPCCVANAAAICGSVYRNVSCRGISGLNCGYRPVRQCDGQVNERRPVPRLGSDCAASVRSV